MNNTLEKLPQLLKRKHMIKDLGISDTLYYKLIRENKLPVVHIGNRIYIIKDKLAVLLESGFLDTSQKDKVDK